MSYTAIENMRKNNEAKYGFDYGPKQPAFHGTSGSDLKSAALRFLHDRCEGLRFNPDIEQEEEKTGTCRGVGIKEGQIPYNMQMDLNRLCLERELESFIDSGSAEDAYTVYYSYFEIFFVSRYSKSKKVIELLSEFESNASSLLMKHRDHYSHSVYVFTLGLAIYESNEYFRKAFKSFYGFSTDENNREEDRKAAHTFLAFWGMTALLHDIGYPFEIPFEQVASYFTESDPDRKNNPYLAYKNMKSLIELSDEEKKHFQKLYHRTFETVEELFAFVVSQKLTDQYGFSEAHIHSVITNKPTHPEAFNFHIDHGYFSALLLYKQLINMPNVLPYLSEKHMDALAAILLHNSLYKHSIAFFKSKDPNVRKAPLPMETFPLAWLLFICDELQCWDRTAYGRNTRQEMHPMGVEMDLSGNALAITYIYDSEEQEKIDDFKRVYKQWEESGEQGKPPRLKEYSDMSEKEQSFAREIESIVDTSNMPLTVKVDVRKADRKAKKTFLSTSSFLHLYDFAVALNGRYAHQDDEKNIPAETLEAEFDSLSLEYQLSNINQAKSFSRYLNHINCFYTDKPVDFSLVTHFTEEQTDIIGALEHERWIHEKQNMDWQYNDIHRTLPVEKLALSEGQSEKEVRKSLREQFRTHELMMEGNPSSEMIHEHYHLLTESDQEKDYMPFNSMLKLIKQFDGLRIYSLSE